jgi:hypothetical protein
VPAKVTDRPSRGYLDPRKGRRPTFPKKSGASERSVTTLREDLWIPTEAADRPWRGSVERLSAPIYSCPDRRSRGVVVALALVLNECSANSSPGANGKARQGPEPEELSERPLRGQRDSRQESASKAARKAVRGARAGLAHSSACHESPVKPPPCARIARARGGAGGAQARSAEHRPGVGILPLKARTRTTARTKPKPKPKPKPRPGSKATRRPEAQPERYARSSTA